MPANFLHFSFIGLHFLWERLSASKIVAKSHSHNNNEKLVNGREIYFPKVSTIFIRLWRMPNKQSLSQKCFVEIWNIIRIAWRVRKIKIRQKVVLGLFVVVLCIWVTETWLQMVFWIMLKLQLFLLTRIKFMIRYLSF